jgi:hypothetical protein
MKIVMECSTRVFGLIGEMTITGWDLDTTTDLLKQHSTMKSTNAYPFIVGMGLY